MKLQGILRTELPFALTHIHLGQKDGVDFSQLSFPAIGDLNNDSDQTTLTADAANLLFDLNGMPLRIAVSRTETGWTVRADLDSIGLHAETAGEMIGCEPAFAPHHCSIPEENLIRLAEHNEYDDFPCEGLLTYELNNAEVLAFIQSRGIDAENRHDFATMCALMKKTSALIHQDGVNSCHDREHRGTIAQILHAEKQNNTTNCRGAAIILCGVLHAYGFCANYVECRPLKEDESDIHVVCEAYAPDLGKTVLLDPSSNLYYMLDDIPLSLIELKEALVSGRAEQIVFSSDAAHGDAEDPGMQMLAYMSKNLICLCKCLNSCESLEMTSDNAICLVPRDLLGSDYSEYERCTSNIREFYAIRAE